VIYILTKYRLGVEVKIRPAAALFDIAVSAAFLKAGNELFTIISI
jgi:hypothetical protein